MSHSETSQQISAYLCRFANLRPLEIEAFVAKGRPRTLQANESFCHLGQDRHEVAFIVEGIVRYFALTSDGTDSTKDFSLQGSFTLSFGRWTLFSAHTSAAQSRRPSFSRTLGRSPAPRS